MADLGKFLNKGVALPLGTDRRQIKLHRHASGGIKFEIGSETVLMAPWQVYDLAMGLLKGINVAVAEHVRPTERDQQLNRPKIIGG